MFFSYFQISKIDDAVLCKICFQKVESYIIFRSQLVTSFERANGTQVPDLISPNCKNKKFTETSKTQISDTGLFIIIKILYKYIHC